MDPKDTDDDTFDLLMKRPGFAFRRCAQAAGGLFERGVRDLGLTTGQYDVLFVLSIEGAVEQDRMAVLLGLDRSTTGVLAKNLEKKGLIGRDVNPSDRRKLILSMTEAGETAFEAARPIAEAARDLVLDPLNETETAQLFALLKRIAVAGTGRDI